ncbi:MAG: hypothetical protein M5U30_13070 [Burkholderiaceae bacterium]|nr:hypothetical protein [Burkholderiaceae bacterium]
MPEAQRLLGELAYQGKGVPRDLAAAFAWNGLAAKAGDRIAQYNLGRMHEDGEGVAGSLGVALYWYEKSGAQQYGPAQFRAGELAMSSDRSKAAYWFSQAALNGDAEAAPRAREAAAAIAAEKTANEEENERSAAIRRREAAEVMAGRAARDEETRKWMQRNPGQPVGANLPPLPSFNVVVPSTSRVIPAPYQTRSSHFSDDPDASGSSGPGRPEGDSGDASRSGRSGATSGARPSSSSTAGASKPSGDSSASDTSGPGRQAGTGSNQGVARSAGKSEASPSLSLTRTEGPDPAMARREEEQRQSQIAKEAKDAAERKAISDAYWKKWKEDEERSRKEIAEKGRRYHECWNDSSKCGKDPGSGLGVSR